MASVAFKLKDIQQIYGFCSQTCCIIFFRLLKNCIQMYLLKMEGFPKASQYAYSRPTQRVWGNYVYRVEIRLTIPSQILDIQNMSMMCSLSLEVGNCLNGSPVQSQRKERVWANLTMASLVTSNGVFNLSYRVMDPYHSPHVLYI